MAVRGNGARDVPRAGLRVLFGLLAASLASVFIGQRTETQLEDRVGEVLRQNVAAEVAQEIGQSGASLLRHPQRQLDAGRSWLAGAWFGRRRSGLIRDIWEPKVEEVLHVGFVNSPLPPNEICKVLNLL